MLTNRYQAIITLSWLLILMPVLLMGCSHLSPATECPFKGGLSCRSLNEVESWVDKQAFNTHAQPDETILTQITGLSAPQRQRPHVLKIWAAPYEDSAGNFHSARFIYTVLGQGRWLVHPIRNTQAGDVHD